MTDFLNLLKDIMTLIYPLGGYGLFIVFVIYIAYFPDKAEKLASLFWKFTRFIYKGAEKKYIKHDIQGRVNDYVNNYLSKEINGFNPMNIRIQWIEPETLGESFLENGEVIVRMRKSDNQNKNFINASMVFISQAVLLKAKKYISKKQRESLDLFVGKKLFETEKEEVVAQFIDDYLQEGNKDERINELLEKYHSIDRHGLFYPVLIQEMTFLGERVFGGHHPTDKIYSEMNGLVDFLEMHSRRRTGESIPSDFNGEFLRFSIMIIGDTQKVNQEGIAPYKYNLEYLGNIGAETIYIIGDSRKEDFIRTVCSINFMENYRYFILSDKKYKSTILNRDDKPVKKETYLLALRREDIEHYISAR